MLYYNNYFKGFLILAYVSGELKKLLKLQSSKFFYTGV